MGKVQRRLLLAVKNGKIDDVRKIIYAHNPTLAAKWSQNNSLLLNALRRGHIDVAKLLLTNEFWADNTNAITTPLHIAAKNGYLEIIEILLNKGIEIDATNKQGYTPLQSLLKKKNMDKNRHFRSKLRINDFKAVELLLKRGANVHVQDKFGNRPIHLAAAKGSTPTVKVLLKFGAHVNYEYAKGQRRYSPLHYAVLSGSLNLFKLLLEQGAHFNACTINQETPLHFAVLKNRLDIVTELLHHGAGVNFLTLDGYSALHYACQKNNLKLFDVLVKSGSIINTVARDLSTPLHTAVTSGCFDIVCRLLKLRANINAEDEKKKTPLEYAVLNESLETVNEILLYEPDSRNESSQEAFRTALLKHGPTYYKIYEALKRYGIQHTITDYHNPELFHSVIEKGLLDVVEEFLNFGANVNCRGKCENRTPLHTAVIQGKWDIVDVLTKHNADLYAQDAKGNIPFFYEKGDNRKKTNDQIFYTLSVLDITRQPRVRSEAILHIINLYLKQGLDINASVNNKLGTLLHIAVRNGIIEATESLLNKGARVTVKDCSGKSPLFYAIKLRKFNILKLIIKADPKMINFVISDRDGATALHYAASRIDKKTFEFILKSEPYINALNNNKETPLIVAIKHQRLHNIQKLLEHGADVNIEDKSGKTPLLAAFNSSSEDLNLFYFGHFNGGSGVIVEVLTIHMVLQQARNNLSDKNKRAMEDYRVRFLVGTYVEEINRLKNEIIENTNVTYFQILTRSYHSVAKYLENEDIQCAYDKKEYKEKFTYYGSALENKFKKGLVRKKLLKHSWESFNLPDPCMEIILSFLGDQDLRNLRDACDFI